MNTKVQPCYEQSIFQQPFLRMRTYTLISYLVIFFHQYWCKNDILLSAVVQLGSNMKYTVFKSESTGAALKSWSNTAKKKHNDPNHVHSPLSTPSSTSHGSSLFDSSSDASSTPHVHTPTHLSHLSILGLNKALDEHGRPVDIPLGTKLHNGHLHGNGHPQTHGTQFTLFV